MDQTSPTFPYMQVSCRNSIRGRALFLLKKTTGTFRGAFSAKSKPVEGLTEEIAILRASPLLDPVWYRMSNPDLRRAPIDAARHYLEHGALEGRDPGPQFDTKFYLEQNPTVAAAGVNPLVHYILRGAAEGLKPNPRFDPLPSRQVTDEIKDIAAPDVELPTRSEAIEKVPSHPIEGLQELAKETNELKDTRRDEIAEFFDADFYRDSYADIAIAKVDPLQHYLCNGWKEGRDPAPWFSTTFYLKNNQDVVKANINPFLHYITVGRDEGRLPKQATNPRRELLEIIMPPKRAEFDAKALDSERITEGYLLRRCRPKFENVSGLALSFSHTCYPRSHCRYRIMYW